MPSIHLLTITSALAEALGPALDRSPDAVRAFEARHRLVLGPHLAHVRDVVAMTEAYRRTTGAPPAWGGRLALDADTRAVVGTCGFKGAPDPDGAVEIAYHTFPAFERRGYAGAMAAALCAWAAASGRVRRVRAHTLPEPNASTRILARLGFACTGTVIDDPADGPVWHWERAVSPAAAAAAG